MLLNHQRAEDLSLRSTDRRAEESLPCRYVDDGPCSSAFPIGTVWCVFAGFACNRDAETLQSNLACRRTGSMCLARPVADSDDLATFADPSHDKGSRVLQETNQDIGGSGPSFENSGRNGQLALVRAISLPIVASPVRRHACFPLKRTAQRSCPSREARRQGQSITTSSHRHPEQNAFKPECALLHPPCVDASFSRRLHQIAKCFSFPRP
ncbi:hypothetical protein RNI52_10330 [Labrys neptuniae]|uniref:hypothetical protein n=1 Tax=Labrys neptuniae TaxID=376174 RepID=UPI0028900D5B|nr:hypothetical protein [Labrys neptuniae]MDT3377714.1 hypothetical protein [Labrys neptuniae]